MIAKGRCIYYGKAKKYSPLVEYLINSNKDIVELTFNEIEEILGFDLAPSAKKYRQSWSNNEYETLTQAWLPAGYESFDVSMSKQIAHFRKAGTAVVPDKKVYKRAFNKRVKTVKSPEDEILLDIPDNLLSLENDEFFMVKLSKGNSSIVEIEIENDFGYRHIGKMAFDVMYSNNDYSKESFYQVINKIATENSTITSKVVMSLLAEYCSNLDNWILERLKEGNPQLVDDLLEHLVKNGEKRDKSLASKNCRYMNEWLYYEDSFTINDSVVRKVLPYYLAYYKIDKSLWYGKNLDDLSYVEFFRLFNALKDLILEMNRHELDHLMWYTYKGAPIRLSIAEAMVEVLVNKY